MWSLYISRTSSIYAEPVACHSVRLKPATLALEHGNEAKQRSAKGQFSIMPCSFVAVVVRRHPAVQRSGRWPAGRLPCFKFHPHATGRPSTARAVEPGSSSRPMLRWIEAVGVRASWAREDAARS